MENTKERFLLSPEEVRIVEENMNLVRYLIQKNYPGLKKENFEDYEQIGAIGLIKAVKTFDKGKSNFSTYASRCILNEIRKENIKNRKFSTDLSFNQAISEVEREDGLTIEDITKDKWSSDFPNRLQLEEEIQELLSFILNAFSSQQKFIILLSIAGIQQVKIAKWIGLSQPQIAKVSAKCKKILKAKFLEYSEKEDYREVFKVVMNETIIRIQFSTSDVESFNQIFAEFLSEMEEKGSIVDFKIERSKELVVINLPKEKEALALLALLVRKIETFQVKCETNLAADDS